MNIVVTGFEPFLDHGSNPTLEVVQLLPKSIKGHPIIPVELPVLYKGAFDKLLSVLEEYKPQVIIALGLAGGRKEISLERLAVNINDANVGDNNQVIKTDEPIIKGGKNAYFSSLPLRKIEKNITEKNISVSISNSAGLYVCNDLMYRILHYVEENNLQAQAGFIHVPFMDEQDHKDMFSMPISTILEAVIDAIKVCII